MEITFENVLYVRQKAEIGKLVRVLVKDIQIPKTYDPELTVRIYVDVNNSYWNERDLITEEEATILIADYYNARLGN